MLVVSMNPETDVVPAMVPTMGTGHCNAALAPDVPDATVIVPEMGVSIVRAAVAADAVARVPARDNGS